MQIPQEVTINPFYVCLDVVKNAINYREFLDHIKTNVKKEIYYLDAAEIFETMYRTIPKNSTQTEISLNLVKAMKAKLDVDLSKMLDSKRRLIAQIEKQRQQYLAAQSRGKKVRAPSILDQPIPNFDGKIDLLIIVLNFPYVPYQLDQLKENGIEIGGFLAITPKDGVSGEIVSEENTEEKQKEKPKKMTIPGFNEFDFTKKPEEYPPARWQALAKDPSILMKEFEAGVDFEDTYFNLERAVVSIFRANEESKEFFSKKSLKEIPIKTDQVNVNSYINYIQQHPGDVFNGLYYQLKEGNYEVLPPQTPPEILEVYTNIFDRLEKENARRYVFCKEKEIIEPSFKLPCNPAVYTILEEQLKWTPPPTPQCTIISKFILAPNNLHAFAGQRFDMLFTQTNKKYQLGLPSAFYDWQKWSISAEYEHGADQLARAIEDCSVVESLFDSDIGVTWVMMMKPIPKVTGNFVKQLYMPQTLLNAGEWMKHIYEFEEETEKKVRSPPSPATVISQKLDYSLLLKPLLTRVDANDTYYRLPIDIAETAHFTTPYFFESGLHVDVVRDLYKGKFDFKYNIFLKTMLDVQSTGDSVVLLPPENIRFTITSPFSFTILFNELSIYFDGEKIVMKQSNENEMIITNNGAFINKHKNQIPLIVHPNGTISQYLNEQWINVDKDGETTINGEIIDRKHSKITDCATGTISVIRPDNFEYAILKDGSRKIIVNPEFSIEQSENEISFDCPEFPLVTTKDGKIFMNIDKFSFELGDQTTLIKCDEYSCFADGEKVTITGGDIEMQLSNESCQIKSGINVFVANAEGVEKMGVLAKVETLKKNAEKIESPWGIFVPNKELNNEQQLLTLHNLFAPRFFMVRSDRTAVEFMRPDILPKMKEKSKTVPHPSEQKTTLMTRHKLGKYSMIYTKYQSLAKPARSNLLKEIHIPKKKKKGEAEVIYDGVEAINDYLKQCAEFAKVIDSTLEELHQKWIDENTPPPPPPPEIHPIPPQTPCPRLQLMMYDYYQPNKYADMNYWNNHESDFAYPLHEPLKPKRPLSPRTGLTDPPRFFRPEKQNDYVKEDTQAFLTQPSMPMKVRSARLPQNSQSRPTTVATTPQIINFGDVETNKSAIASLVLTNTGTSPLHYAVTQIKDANFKMLSIPGVVYPGLKTTIKVALVPSKKVAKLESSFQFKCKQFDLTIPVYANIVQEQ